MRIVLVPEAQLSNPYADSDFRLFLTLARNLAAGNNFVYLVAPEEAAKCLSPERGIHFVTIDKPGPFLDLEAAAPLGFSEMFNARVGRFPVDAIITSRSAAGVALARHVMDTRRKGGEIPVIIDEQKASDFGEGHMNINDVTMMARTLSYAVAWPVFHSQWELETACSAAKRYLNPATVNLAFSKAKVIPLWIDTDRMDKAVRNQERSSDFTLFFAGRLNVAKRADKMLEIYEKFRIFGRNVKVVICSPREERAVDWQSEYPSFEFHAGLSGEEFYRKAAAAHVYLNTSRFEGFSVGFLEQLYLGLVAIFPDAPWTRGLLGDKFVDEYPLAYGTLEEAGVMLRRVYNDYEWAKEQVSDLPALIRKWYGSPELKDLLYGHVKGIVESRGHLELSPMMGDLVVRALRRVDRPFSLRDLYGVIGRLSAGFRDSPTRGQPSKWDVYKWLISKGFRDLCDGPDPRFVEDP